MTQEQRFLIEEYFDRLFPIHRSIAGDGFRQSLDMISELMPTERLRYPSGSKAFDWDVPLEWRVRDACIIDPNGEKHADFKNNNLHLMAYSIPVKERMSLDKLKSYIYTCPETPKAVPFATSYYGKKWGFCLSDEDLQNLPDGDYEVVIDTEFYNGFLESGEAVIPGESDEEILFSTYLCHPSMANNELSGPLVMAFLYQRISAMNKRRYTYRFVINAETIGTVCYLSKRGEHLKNKVKAGFVLTSLGDKGAFHYKRSRQQNSLSDRAMEAVLKHSEENSRSYQVYDFDPSKGSEERQYCSPGFNLPIGCFMRSVPGSYPEYHTSLDDKNFISFDRMLGSVDVLYEVVQVIENNHVWIRQNPCCEPQLSRRGLYPDVSLKLHDEKSVAASLWLLNYADGCHDLLDISSLSGISSGLLSEVAAELVKNDLIKVPA